MPKPTSPQPPVPTDDECDALIAKYYAPFATHTSLRRLIRVVRAAGCEAQRKVDAALVRKARENRATVQVFDVLADLIERTPEQPTTKRCGTCGSENPKLKPWLGGCPDVFHSQPTTGEAGDGL